MADRDVIYINRLEQSVMDSLYDVIDSSYTYYHQNMYCEPLKYNVPDFFESENKFDEQSGNDAIEELYAFLSLKRIVAFMQQMVAVLKYLDNTVEIQSTNC